ncbi:hypothetical protein O3M35_001521 [Rhynocoris fuscipes]|uniref:Uncharacterized protein n=1 Tax=Rhynocoris fuscipes TaxID=488301 RepID=A0AAW1CP98_9HEMI
MVKVNRQTLHMSCIYFKSDYYGATFSFKYIISFKALPPPPLPPPPPPLPPPPPPLPHTPHPHTPPSPLLLIYNVKSK